MTTENAPASDGPLQIIVVTSLLVHPLNCHLAHGLADAAKSFKGDISLALVHPNFATSEINTALEREMGPDLVIFLGSSSYSAGPVEEIGATAVRAGAQTAFWATDDPYELDFASRADGFDFYFSNDATAALSMMELRENVFHLPLAASYSDFFPTRDDAQPRPRLSRDFVFFCGTPYQNRVAFLKDFNDMARRNDGPNLLVSGPNWESTGLDTVPTPDTIEALKVYYRSARLVLYLHRSYSIANSRFKLPSTTPGPRIFEAAMAGCSQVSEFFSFELEHYFDPDNEVPVVHDGCAGADLVKCLLQDRHLTDRLADAAQYRAIADHTWEDRLVRLIAKTHPNCAAKLDNRLNEITAQRLSKIKLR